MSVALAVIFPKRDMVFDVGIDGCNRQTGNPPPHLAHSYRHPNSRRFMKHPENVVIRRSDYRAPGFWWIGWSSALNLIRSRRALSRASPA